MSKYKKIYKQMVTEYEDFFMEFKKLHDAYKENPGEYKVAFNEMGQKILRIIRRYDDELCSKSENSGYGKFSENLSEKFWEEIRSTFPLIDKVELR